MTAISQHLGARALALPFAICLLGAPAELAAQQPGPVTVERRVDGTFEPDARATRQTFIELLRRHPPAVGRVLKLDPALMQNESYLAPYPALQQFLAQHPEVRQNASFYLQPIEGGDDSWTPPSPQMRLLEGTLAGLSVLAGMGIVLGGLIWTIRTVIDQRRWNRLSRIQAEVHTKLMDRFSSNDELLKYVQMPAGQRFLESGPSPLQEQVPAAIGAPFARILWSVQIGAVLLVAGLGLLFLSGRGAAEMQEFFFIFGCLAAALGAGFVVSAGAAYLLSRRLGLLGGQAETHA
jgi:hypothetical protein